MNQHTSIDTIRFVFNFVIKSGPFEKSSMERMEWSGMEASSFSKSRDDAANLHGKMHSTVKINFKIACKTIEICAKERKRKDTERCDSI